MDLIDLGLHLNLDLAMTKYQCWPPPSLILTFRLDRTEASAAAASAVPFIDMV